MCGEQKIKFLREKYFIAFLNDHAYVILSRQTQKEIDMTAVNHQTFRIISALCKPECALF